MLARLGRPALDSRLAAGVSPDTDPLLAARARLLVRPLSRRRLLGAWVGLMERARDPGRPQVMGSRVPVCRINVLDAVDEIEQLCRALAARAPVPVQGVAMADSLLRDGAGPVYNDRNREDLRTALRRAIRYLDPSRALLSPGE